MNSPSRDPRDSYEPAASGFGPRADELESLARRIAATPLSAAARQLLERGLEHYRRSAPAGSLAARLRNHIEWTLELPWAPPPAPRGGQREFERVARALEASHHGLSEVKQRIFEFLAVRHLQQEARGAVLCFVGPPGTGKSSMGRAVAHALGRAVSELCIGGMREVSELRGRAAVEAGGRPGAILAGLHRAGTRNPVLLLDEIDELPLLEGAAVGGALSRVLDREQNAEFLDDYLGVPFDLSRCLILATANDLGELPEALVDRLEVIEFSGYTESEKLAIARKHLLPRARAGAALQPHQLRLTAPALLALIRNYTEEAGVRHLQRLLDSLSRKAAMDVVRGGPGLYVRKANLLGLLGPAVVEDELRLRQPALGIATGLAWTSAGGSLLPVEALGVPGAGRTILTGQVGEVLRESVQTAITYARTCFGPLGLEVDALDALDLHLHFPAAATPKDGPSAGIAILTALVSLLSGVPSRHDVAMTGELSLHGNVLPVGGIRDKLLAAARAGMGEAIVPARNCQEVLKLPGEVRRKLEIHLVEDARSIFELALVENLGLGADAPAVARVPRGRSARGARERRPRT